MPPRHDLWRTVSEDTISVPLKEAPSKQPLLRHISMDNIRPATKVSNIQPLAQHPHQSTTSMNSVSSSLDGPPPAHLGRSVESVGGYSDRDGLDSDGSLHTPEEPLTLPSVRRLASKFDSAPQKVNNLDKHGKTVSLLHLLAVSQLGQRCCVCLVVCWWRKIHSSRNLLIINIQNIHQSELIFTLMKIKYLFG